METRGTAEKKMSQSAARWEAGEVNGGQFSEQHGKEGVQTYE